MQKQRTSLLTSFFYNSSLFQSKISPNKWAEIIPLLQFNIFQTIKLDDIHADYPMSVPHYLPPSTTKVPDVS